MAFDSQPDLKLTLVTVICLIVAWGPVFAAIAIGIASGVRSAESDSAKPGAKPRG